MFFFALNLLITLVWVGLSQDLSFSNLFLGFLIGFVLLFAISPMFPQRGYFSKIFLFLEFLIFYIYELIKSNLEVAWDVLTPQDLSEPAIVRIPLEIKSDIQIALLMNLITFTPGSLSVDLSKDKKTLYVHGMFVDDEEQFRANIKEGFERKIRKLFGD